MHMKRLCCCVSNDEYLDRGYRIAEAIAVLDSTASEIKDTFDELYGRDRVVLDSVEARALSCGTAVSSTGTR